MANRAAQPGPAGQDGEPATTVKGGKVPSIARALAALHVLGQSPTPLGVQAVARQLGVVTSSCYYLLQALVAEEMVAFDPDTKRYSLGPGVLTLAQYWYRQNRFGDLVQPHVNEVFRRVEQQLLDAGHTLARLGLAPDPDVVHLAVPVDVGDLDAGHDGR